MSQVEEFARLIRDALPRHANDINAAASDVAETVGGLVGQLSAEMKCHLRDATELVRDEFADIEILRHHSVIQPREEWYHGPVAGDRHWPALKGYLLGAKGWDTQTIEAIDDTSSEIVSLLENPSKPQFSCRGLVVGHVQSGKTANMTAVIAKAIDSGYNVIIVLAGLTDKLRQQTQKRMEQDLVSLNPLLWHRLTQADIKGDFQLMSHGHLMHMSDRTQIAITKKNPAPLRKLLDTLRKTPKVELSRHKVLIIDDECDQASVNSASGEFDVTKINELIRQFVTADILPAVSYVGYTATPFANVLIDPYAGNTHEIDDLYPRDFITALPTPRGYFGAERLFGRVPDNANGDDPAAESLDVIRDVSEGDEALLQPPSAKAREQFFPKLPESLQDAILWFIMTCCVRRARGQSEQHMTMLVHTSPYVSMHNRVADLIAAWVGQSKDDILLGHGEISSMMSRVWNDEVERVPRATTSGRQIHFDEMRSHLADVLTALEVPVENGSSTDRIDYDQSARTYIVVGGTILARGLTLEGLCVSYFLRNANQYDTLLQMGRWFGYRGGYEDLPRLWMPKNLQLSFRALASIEAEIRQDISEYAQQSNVTPMDFAVRVRTIPGMAVTGRYKMRHARACDVSYSGRHVQTLRFDRTNESLLKANWQAGSNLVGTAETLQARSERDDKIIYENVPHTAVVNFLRAYSVHETHRDLTSEMLLSYIESNSGSLSEWNIGVLTTSVGRVGENSLGPLVGLQLFRRTRLSYGPDDIADIKALMSRQDILADCPGADAYGTTNWTELKKLRESQIGHTPLLLLYPIDGHSEPKPGKTSRLPLDATFDVLGFGIVFPGATDLSGRFVSVDLDPVSGDELDERDAEDQAAVEALGDE